MIYIKYYQNILKNINNFFLFLFFLASEAITYNNKWWHILLFNIDNVFYITLVVNEIFMLYTINIKNNYSLW